MAGPTRVLVTGFSAFPNAPDNPTATLVRTLLRERRRLARCGIDLQTLVLPVTFGVAPALVDVLTRLDPAVVLHFGLAARRRGLAVEARAANRAGILHPDAAGRCAPALRIVPAAPSHRAARLPLRQVVAAVRAAGTACLPSIDAGDYVCNETLFRSLASGVPIVGFIHVPRLRGRISRRGGRLTPLAVHRAAMTAIVIAARAARQDRAMSSAARP